MCKAGSVNRPVGGGRGSSADQVVLVCYRMIWPVLFLSLIFGALGGTLVEEGPRSGVVLRESPGLLLTEVQERTQRVFVHIDPQSYVQGYWGEPEKVEGIGIAPGVSMAQIDQALLDHAEATVAETLRQLEKVMISNEGLRAQNGEVRTKRFLGALLGAAAGLGTLFNLGLGTANRVSITHLQDSAQAIEAELAFLRSQVEVQKEALLAVGKTLEKTIVVVNHHTQLVNRTMTRLASYFETKIASAMMKQDIVRDLLEGTEGAVLSLVQNVIPSRFVSVGLMQEVLGADGSHPVGEEQVHLAFSLARAIPVYVSPERRELAFVLTVPMVRPQNMYFLREVVNLGAWHGNAHVRVQTPLFVAYRPGEESTYLEPNLRMCVLTKGVHYVCPHRPFVRDSSLGICGVTPMSTGAKCASTITPRERVVDTQYEAVGHRWLVNTPLSQGTVIHNQFGVQIPLELPNQTCWIEVFPGSVVRVGEAMLYSLHSEVKDVVVDASEFYGGRALNLTSEVLQLMEAGEVQVVDLTPLKETITNLNKAPRLGYRSAAQLWRSDVSLGVGLGLSCGVAVLVGTVGVLFLLRRKDQAEFLHLKRQVRLLSQMSGRQRGGRSLPVLEGVDETGV